MKVIALLLIILIASSNATSLFDRYPLKFGPKRSIMTLLTQIEAALKNGGPLDMITKMLEEFRTTIVEEQQTHDRLFAEQQARCTEELEMRRNEINAATVTLTEAKGTLDSCTAQHNRATADLSVTDDQLISNTNALSELTRQRQREKYSFDTLANVWQLTSQAVASALQILQEMWQQEKGASFIQLAGSVNTILKHSIAMGSHRFHGLGELMTSLAQLKNADIAADESLFERVKTLLTNFKDKKEQEFLAASVAEEASVNEYLASKARYDTVIAHLRQQKDDLEAEIKKLNKCIVVQTGLVNTSTAKRDRNQGLLDDATALCNSVTQEYTISTQQRKEELDLLGQIKDRVIARFATISEGVQERGKLDANQFSHTNAYTGFAETN